MSAIRLLFGRSRTLGSLLVRAGTISVWGHVGVVTPNGTVIEARAWEGVVERPMAEVIAGMSHHEVVQVSVPDAAAGLAWARSTLGTRYDWAGVLAIPGRRDWQASDRWFCSEHAEATVLAAGRARVRSAWRVTPALCYELAR